MCSVMDLKTRLVEACKNHLFLPNEPGPAATIPEPYIPYVPNPWNGTLVLAEAQNHAKRSGQEPGYLDWLKSLSSDERIERLYLWSEDLGIQPWDDGSPGG